MFDNNCILCWLCCCNVVLHWEVNTSRQVHCSLRLMAWVFVCTRPSLMHALCLLPPLANSTRYPQLVSEQFRLCFSKGQNPLHQFPRSKSATSPLRKRQVRNKCATSWRGKKFVVSVVSCRFPNSITTSCCHLRGSYGETCPMYFVHKWA